MPTENDYHLEGTKKVYHNKESENLAKIRSASARPFSGNRDYVGENINTLFSKSGEEKEKEEQEEHERIMSKQSSIRDYYNRPSSSKGVRDADQSIFVAKVARSMINQRQIQAPTSQMSDDPASLNYNADFATAQMIVTSLKQNELSSGKEYSSSELADLIRKRFAGVNENIVQMALDLLATDVQGVNARVAGSNINDFRLMYSAKNNQQRLQDQQQQQQQQNNPNSSGSRANTQFPQQLQDQINALSESDKQLLQQTAQSVVNDILSQTTDPIDEITLENQIATQYNVSSTIADLIVEVLKSIPDYTKLITPTQQQDQNQTQSNNPATAAVTPKRPTIEKQQKTLQKQDQQQQDTTDDNNNNNSNDTSKQSFVGYRHMNHCLQDQSTNYIAPFLLLDG